MAKKASIIIIIITLIVGIGAVCFKTIQQANKTQEGITEVPISSTGTASQGDETLSSQTITPNPSSETVQTTNQPVTEKGPYPMQIDTKKTYEAVLKTSLGDITIQLHADTTPITVNNFVVLAQKKFYNNTIFHRVIKGFMIQGGDPKGDGTGGPGYTFNDEPFDGEYTRGTVAMANAGPNTNGSQFFIMHKDNPLPKNYVIFGTVIKGIEVVDAIAESPTEPGGEGSKPIKPTTITSVEIIVR